MCVCVCVCVCGERDRDREEWNVTYSSNSLSQSKSPGSVSEKEKRERLVFNDTIKFVVLKTLNGKASIGRPQRRVCNGPSERAMCPRLWWQRRKGADHRSEICSGNPAGGPCR